MRHVLHRTPRTSAGLAAIAVFATCGTALAQAGVTTLNSAKSTLFSMNGTPTSSYWTYTGPTTNTGGPVAMTSFAEPNTGLSRLAVTGFFIWDVLDMVWTNPSANASASVRFEWDITFNSATGGVQLAFGDSDGTTTITPFGGSAVSLGVGDYLANGRYTLTWDFTDPNVTSGPGASFGFAQGTGGGGGAVPLPGAAGLAAIGLVGLARRRRR